MRFAWGKASDVGRVRSNNQDSLLADDDLWAVADGMGGHRGGEIASGLAVEVIAESYSDATFDALFAAVSHANEVIFSRAVADPELRGMGTTLVAIAPIDDEGETLLAWVSIGDSRLYRWHDGDLDQITEDHSLVEEMVRDGRLSADEARFHPQRNILTRALGIDEHPTIDSGTVVPYEGDRFLLCSDGLFNEVDAGRMIATLRRLSDPADTARELVRQALESGGRDNITVIVVDVVDDDHAAARASAAVTGGTAEGHARGSRSTPERSAPAGAEERPKRHRKETARRVTPRLVLFVAVLVSIVVGAGFAVQRIARGGYTVKQHGNDVVIYKGNGERVLWLAPAVQQDLGPVAVVDRYKQAVTRGEHFSSLSGAKAFSAQIASNAPVTTKTTTTSTVPAAGTVSGGPVTTTGATSSPP